VVKAAIPFVSRGTTALMDPALKVTVPVGGEPPPLTVAVKVIAWPYVEGFADEPIAVVVAGSAGGFTTSESVPMLAAKLPSPL
jgi:hypothetical protein